MDSAFDINEFIKHVAALIAVLNPISAAAALLSLTPGASPKERAGVAAIASITVFVTLTIATLIGGEILTLFAISVDVFRMAGGLVILLVALSIIRAQPAREPEVADKPRQNPGVVPLGIPLLAGAGSISTAIVFANDPHPLWADSLAHGASIIAASLLVFGCLIAAVPLQRVVGQTSLRVVTQVMGLILAAVGIEMIAHGITGRFGVGLGL